MKMKWICSLLLASPLWVEAGNSPPAHGYEIQGFGKPVSVEAISQLAMQGRKLRMNGQEMRSRGDWLSGIQRVYSLAEGRALIIVGKEAEASYYELTGTRLLRMHETGVALTRTLSRFATLGWPQQNPDFRVFPEISAVLSARSGELQIYRLGSYATDGLLLVSPDGQRSVSQSSNGAVLVYGLDGRLQAVLWPEAQIVAEAKEQRWAEIRQMVAPGGMFEKAQSGHVESYITYKWVEKNFSWYQKSGQWELQGLGLNSEAEAHSRDIRKYIDNSFEHLIATGNPLPWRNFHVDHPGLINAKGQANDSEVLATSFDLVRPLSVLGVTVKGIDMPKLQLRLFSTQSVTEAEASMVRFFASRGMQIERVNEIYLRISGGVTPLFVLLQSAESPYKSALTVMRYAGHGCGGCSYE
jgi:hypothetical protein